MPDELARTPEPPYYAVLFSLLRTEGDQGYGARTARMMELAAEQAGFLGVESTRGAGGLGITISYWKDIESIAAWKSNAEHLEAQRAGRERWNSDFTVRIARVERQYGL